MFKDLKEDYQVDQLKERIKVLEERVFKTDKKKVTTRAQQMLLVKYLGINGLLDDLKLGRNKKAELLSILLNAGEGYIKDDLTDLHKDFMGIENKVNYKFLIDTLQKLGLTKLEKEAENKLAKLIALEESKSKKRKEF